MAKNEKFLTIDIGATSIKLCEFETDRSGQMAMTLFAYREYEEELSDDTRSEVIEGVLRQMLMENSVRSRKVMLSLSGQSSLIRFGKITLPVRNDRKQIRQLAEFEAKRNLPFALDQISLDYQLIAGSQEDQENGNVEVMSIIVKNDIVNMVTQIAEHVGLRPVLIDVAPVACYNAARANNVGEESCELIVSIGGRSTNLMFIEGERFFARTIPIAGYSITQQIAKEFGIGIPEAEELKRHHGYVALSNAPEEAAEGEDSTAQRVSRIVRNVMTRLYGEISRSVNIYRAQQHGSTPTKLYLTGGSSILTYCDVFFSEKFKIPVEYFNSLRVINLSENIERERLSEVAHMLGETIGLAFRYTRACPIEINILPKRIQRQQALNAKVPYLIASMACIVVLFAVIYMGAKYAAVEMQTQQKAYAAEWKKYERPFKDITTAISNAATAREQIENLRAMLTQRAVWPLIVEEIYRAKPANVWIDSITPVFGQVTARKAESSVTDVVDTQQRGPGGLNFGGLDFNMPGAPGMPNANGKAPELTKTAIGGFKIKAHTFRLYGVDKAPDPELAPEPAYPFAVPQTENNDNADGEKAASLEPEQLDQSGDNLFLRNLRKSHLFNSDDQITTLVTNKQSQILAMNTWDFEIQIKLDITTEAVPWPAPASTGRSGGNYETDAPRRR